MDQPDFQPPEKPPANVPPRISGWLAWIVAGAIVAAYVAHRLPSHAAELAQKYDGFPYEGWLFLYWYAYGLAMTVTACIFRPLLFARLPPTSDEENESP